MVSYMLSIWSNRLSRTVFEILTFKDIGVSRLTSSVTWPLDFWYAVSYRWSFKTIAVSSIVVEILCVKHLAKPIPIENALIPIFVLGANRRLQHFATCSRSLGTSFELLTAQLVHGPCYAVFGPSYWKCITGVKNWGKIREGPSDFDP